MLFCNNWQSNVFVLKKKQSGDCTIMEQSEALRHCCHLLLCFHFLLFIINNNILLLWQWIHGNGKKCFSTELRFCVRKKKIYIYDN